MKFGAGVQLVVRIILLLLVSSAPLMAAENSINTFDSPNAVVPKPAAVKVQNGKLSLTVAPQSVTVISIGP